MILTNSSQLTNFLALYQFYSRRDWHDWLIWFFYIKISKQFFLEWSVSTRKYFGPKLDIRSIVNCGMFWLWAAWFWSDCNFVEISELSCWHTSTSTSQPTKRRSWEIFKKLPQIMLKIYDQILSKFMTKIYDQKLLAHLHHLNPPNQPTEVPRKVHLFGTVSLKVKIVKNSSARIQNL